MRREMDKKERECQSMKGEKRKNEQVTKGNERTKEEKRTYTVAVKIVRPPGKFFLFR